LKQKKVEQKNESLTNMDVTLWTKLIPPVFCEHLSIWFQVSSKKWKTKLIPPVFCELLSIWFQVSSNKWRLEIISTNVHKTPVACFEYTVAPGRRPPHCHDHFNAVFPIQMHYLLFH